jgi:hypothetical protein
MRCSAAYSGVRLRPECRTEGVEAQLAGGQRQAAGTGSE